MSFEFDSDVETTLLVVRECFVYKIPPRTNAAGYKAGDWDLSNPMWTGRLIVTSKGSQALVKLEDPSSGETFAVCPVTEASIEPVTDSSRYYVLKIEDGNKRHAFVGMGFAERSEAFDFSAALQDHARYIKQERDSQKAIENLQSRPHVDYSLKEGEKIKVEIKTATNKKTAPKSSGEGFTGLLPPPPGVKKTVSPVQPPANTTAAAPSNNDPWADFSSFTGSSQPKPTQPSPFGNNNWSGF